MLTDEQQIELAVATAEIENAYSVKALCLILNKEKRIDYPPARDAHQIVRDIDLYASNGDIAMRCAEFYTLGCDGYKRCFAFATAALRIARKRMADEELKYQKPDHKCINLKIAGQIIAQCSYCTPPNRLRALCFEHRPARIESAEALFSYCYHELCRSSDPLPKGFSKSEAAFKIKRANPEATTDLLMIDRDLRARSPQERAYQDRVKSKRKQAKRTHKQEKRRQEDVAASVVSAFKY